MASRYCEGCGGELLPAAKFCGRCGRATLQGDATPQPAAAARTVRDTPPPPPPTTVQSTSAFMDAWDHQGAAPPQAPAATPGTGYVYPDALQGDLGVLSPVLAGCVPPTVGRRIAATLIDSLVVNLCALPGYILAMVGTANGSLGAWAIGLLLMLASPAVGIYQWWRNASTGQTIGKKTMNLRLVDLSGGAPGWGPTAARYLLFAVTSSVFFIGGIIGLVNMSQDRWTRRAWYDKSTGLALADLGAGRDPAPRDAERQSRARDGAGLGAAPLPGSRDEAVGEAPSGRVPSSFAVPAPNWAPSAPSPASRAASAASIMRDVEPDHGRQESLSLDDSIDMVGPPPGFASSTPTGPAEPSRSQAPEPAVSLPPERDRELQATTIPVEDPEDMTVAAAERGNHDAAEETDDDGATVMRVRRPRTTGYRLEFADGTTMHVTSTALIGRSPVPRGNEKVSDLLKVADPERTVSKTHLRLEVVSDGLQIKDRGSSNGTEVFLPDGDTQVLTRNVPFVVPDGGTVEIGDVSFTVVKQ